MRSFLLFVLIIWSASVVAQTETFWERTAIGYIGDYELVTAPGAEKKFIESVDAQTRKILKRFPPSQWQYVSIGRSGAAIAAHLEVLAETNPEIAVRTLAWSSVRETKKNLDTEVVKFADGYLRRYLPEQGKKIAFIDYAQMGESIVSFDSFIKDILPSGSYGYYLMLSPERSFALRYYLLRRMPRATKMAVLSVRDLLYRALYNQGLDFYAEYGRFPVKAEAEKYRGKFTDVELESNPEHRLFVDWIRYAHRKYISRSAAAGGMCREIFVF